MDWQRGWNAAQRMAAGNEDPAVSDASLERYAQHDGCNVIEFAAGWREFCGAGAQLDLEAALDEIGILDVLLPVGSK